uniref:Uncharacterized protein n=1 Tax=Setaria viridis TaxID=4556 RepID=A0A4U6W0N6_SETVI|nr:hypothetical protein SEVIR_2G408166v2 [Setaria viridis]
MGTSCANTSLIENSEFLLVYVISHMNYRCRLPFCSRAAKVFMNFQQAKPDMRLGSRYV